MKKFFMTLAVAGMVLTGCTKNEIKSSDVPNPDVIGFMSSTSRAAIADISTLTGDAGGFRVYAATTGGTAWHTNVDGANNYAYATSNWGWVVTAAEWPTAGGAYPMTFYAMYPADEPTTATPSANPSLSRTVTIAAAAADQKDLLAAKATAESKPASGKLSMTFDHILSKVNFGVIAGHDMAPYVQAVKVVNVNGHNTYNYITHAWGNTTSLPATYVYFQNTTTPFTTTGSDASEEMDVPFYTTTTVPTAANAHLMLMPQNQTSGAPAAWDPQSGAPGTAAHIEVIYRITTTTPSDYIGYTLGNDYMTHFPDFDNPGWGEYGGGLGDGTTGTYNDALFVRAGFPVTVAWEPGYGYTYNICLGTANSTNGYYIDNTYYDKDGADTGIPIVGPDDQPVTPGDPVTSGIINFLIKVANWDDSPAVTPLQ